MVGMGDAVGVSGDEGRLASALTRSGLLQGLDEGRRNSLLKRLRLRCHEYSFGEELCHEGDRATSFLLLTRGTVDVVGHTTSGEVFIERRDAGNLIGELAAIRPGATRSATVTARTHDTQAYLFEMASLDALPVEDKVEVWKGLAVHVAAKLANTVPERSSALRRGQEREELLRRFVNEDVLRSIRSATHEEYERREAVILFSDLVGFSALAAQVGGEDLAATIQLAMSLQSFAVEGHGGYVDKFMGDGMMAYWLPHSDDPKELRRVSNAAVDAALQIEARVREVPSPLQDRQLAVRVGLHVGRVHIGNFGSKSRWAFTLIGQPVNVAARIESAKPPQGGADYGSIRASTDLAEYLDDKHLQALPGSAEVQVKTDLVRFVHSKPE